MILVDVVVLSKINKRWGFKKVKAEELEPFHAAINQAVDDLDYALRMYYIELQQCGVSEREIVDRMRDTFKKALEGVS